MRAPLALLAALFVAPAAVRANPLDMYGFLSRSTAMGALLAHITGDAEAETYQPMNVNFGLFPPLHDVKKKQRKLAYTSRGKEEFGEWLGSEGAVTA